MRFHDAVNVEEAVQNTLPDWVARLDAVAKQWFSIPPRRAGHGGHGKVVHDAVFGTKSWEPWLVDIVDTYALQRLRQIRQLSLASLTFPSAEHTRFPHSLGVLARVQQLADRVELRSPVKENACAAALLHDIGHGPFSHLSEDAYRMFGWFDGVVGTPESFFGPGTKPHEALGALMLLTPTATAWIDDLNERHGTKLDGRTMASFITGKAADDKAVAGLLVNGALDGDKLDYLLRDAYMAGLGIGIDVDRWLLSYPKHESLRKLELDDGLSRRLPEQVAFGKWTLREAVYYHAKVRAADIAYMQWAIAMAGDGDAKLGGVIVHSPVDFLRLTDADVMSSHTPAEGSVQSEQGEAVVEVLRRRLRSRELPVVVEEYSKEQLAERGLHRLLFGADDRGTRSAVTNAVRRASKSLAEEVGAETSFDVWLDVPETWTKDQTREYARGGVEGEEDHEQSADVSERVGEIFDDEKYRARLFAHPSIFHEVLSGTNVLFESLREAARL